MRHPACDAAERDTRWLEFTLQEESGRLAVDARGRGENHFANVFAGDAFFQFSDRKIVGADAFERRQQSSEYEVPAAHVSRAFDRLQVVHACDDAQDGVVALGIAAHVA